MNMENGMETSKLIKRHLFEQRFAVLATQFEYQPYTNLIAFTEADNMRSLLFVTSRETRKYTNTMASKKVAVLIDNRKNQESDLHSAVAITALGIVEEVAAENRDDMSIIFLSKHPQLKDFLHNPVSALMIVAIKEYIVATFENVRLIRIEELINLP